MLSLADILSSLTSYTPTGAEPALSSVVTDSREAVPGSLFVALRGERVDGHQFLAEAFQRGAVAALVERAPAQAGACSTVDLRDGLGQVQPLDVSNVPVCIIVDDVLAALQTAAHAWRQRFAVKVIGVTGSVGKSSTKEMAHAVLAQRYRTFKTPGNKNSVIGMPAALFDLRADHERAVVEMGMYTTGEIARMCEIAEPEVGLVTMIGPVHLERAGSMEAIVAAKRELVEALPAGGVAILNYDDERVMSMVEHTPARIFTYGLNPGADLWADNVHSMGLEGVRFVLHYDGEELSVNVPLLGRHSVHTALRAAAAGIVEGLSWEEIASGLSETTAAQLRLVAVPGPRDSIIIDDTYNSSPDSALAALNLLEDLGGRHIAVLGDMLELGTAEVASHRLVGRRAADVAEIVIAVGERAKTIADEAAAVGMPAAAVHWVGTVDEAVPLVEEMIRPKDMVLVKGSYGMRMDRLVAALSKDS